MNTKMIKVGDKVYIVPKDTRNKPYYTEVLCIGKKYITVKGHISESRFSIFTHVSADYNNWNPWLILYESKEAYEEIKKRQNRWGYLWHKIEEEHLLQNATVEQLEQVYNILKNETK